MRVAYADPPYLGSSVKHYGALHIDAADFDNPQRHQALIEELSGYEAWVLSLSSPSLRQILPMCPASVRVLAWVKPFASFKPNIGVAYAWEPVVVQGGRKRTRKQRTVRDWVSVNITLRRGFPGAKPQEFCYWLFDVLNLEPDDEFFDLFPGSGAVTKAWEQWRQHGSFALMEAL